MKILVLFAALLLQQANGCDPPAKPPAPAAMTKHPIQRFVPVEAALHEGVALDTVTGRLCRTWNWSYKEPSLNGGMDNLIACYQIYKDEPIESTSRVAP
jgi:hypothetical protein